MARKNNRLELVEERNKLVYCKFFSNYKNILYSDYNLLFIGFWKCSKEFFFDGLLEFIDGAP